MKFWIRNLSVGAITAIVTMAAGGIGLAAGCSLGNTSFASASGEAVYLPENGCHINFNTSRSLNEIEEDYLFCVEKHEQWMKLYQQ